jgi:hypothetical protein
LLLVRIGRAKSEVGRAKSEVGRAKSEVDVEQRKGGRLSECCVQL